MESITKPVVTHDQLAAICKAHLCDRLEAAEELKDGWFNAAFLLTSAAGRQAVLKTAPPDTVRLMRYEENLMHAEVAALRLIKRMTNVPVPNVIAYDKSRDIVESDFFLSDLLPGRPLNLVRSELDEETQTRVDRQIGTHLKEIHQIQGPQFGTYNLQEFVTWSDAFTTLMDWLRKDASDLKVDLPHRAFEAAEPHLWALDEVKSPTLVHWDLWDGNIFVDTATGTVTGFIDFERVLWADPLIETNFGAPRPAFVEAYGSEILQSPGADSRRKLYQLYLYLIMVIECHFRHFTHEHETEIRTLLDGAIARCRA